MLKGPCVNKAVYKADPSRGGFIQATLAPVNRVHEPRFYPLDAVMILALILGTVAVMRYILAH